MGLNQVDQYAYDVLDGTIPAGKLIKAACKRHLQDLDNDRVLYFDLDAADYAIDFFHFLKHSKGEWAGTTFELSLWQKFIVGSLFGWKRPDGARRFRTAYIEIPRKNGKSTMIAGIGLYLFVADGEQGAEVYSAATKRDQARITHGEATRMVKTSPNLRKRIGVYRDNLHIESTASKFEPLGADADTMDGLNVHSAIIDELHAHKTREVWDVLETATGSRRQPLIIAITTAGTDRNSICWEQHDYAEKILNGTIQDDSYFAYIAAIDEGDDWTDPKTWAKANPNLGISVKIDDLERKCEKAKQLPSAQNTFLRLHLNKWTQQVDRWISLDLWDENGAEIDEAELAGRTCYGGLDLASVSDLAAWVMVFPRVDDLDHLDVLARFWCPEARLYDEHNQYRDQYQAWRAQGYLTATPGDATEYSYIRSQILDDAQKFGLVDLNVDRLFQAHQLAMELIDEGLVVLGMGQGSLSMAAPMAEFERRLLLHKINHGHNPIMRFCADNVAVKQDAAGNLKPDKANSQGKIDGIVALVMALDRAMRHQQDKPSVYESRGIVIL